MERFDQIVSTIRYCDISEAMISAHEIHFWGD